MSSRLWALLLALLAVPWWGCKGNVNENHPTIAVTDRVSVSSTGIQGDQPSLFASITPDGRFVAFSSKSGSLGYANPLGLEQVYVRDLTTGTTTLVSVNTGGLAGNGHSSRPSISATGQWVAFQSLADDLIGSDTNGYSDIFVRDLSGAGSTIRVSVITGAGAESVNGSLGATGAAISADGAFVAFESDATDLTADPYPPTFSNVFRHPNLANGTTELVSITTANNGAVFANAPSISEDGGLIAFVSSDTDLTLAGTVGNQHIFLKTMGGATELVSQSSGGAESNGLSDRPWISPDGMFVCFESDAFNLTPDTNGGTVDIFVRDRNGGGTTTLVSVSSEGIQGTGASQLSCISRDGRYVAFVSASTNLVSGDGNGQPDVFWRDRLLGVTRRISVRTYGAEANGQSSISRPVLTDDGRFVAFDSAAFNLVINDGNGVDDIFIHGPVY